MSQRPWLGAGAAHWPPVRAERPKSPGEARLAKLGAATQAGERWNQPRSDVDLEMRRCGDGFVVMCLYHPLSVKISARISCDSVEHGECDRAFAVTFFFIEFKIQTELN